MIKSAIDIGSNTVQMLIGEIIDGKLQHKSSYLHTTRLGGNCDGLLTKSAINDTIAVLKEYIEIANLAGVEDINIVATAAVREAVNKKDFLNAACAACGYDVDVIDGLREAELSACGALSGNLTDIVNNTLVIDIGGGSTELIYRDQNRNISAVSIKMGARRAAINNWSAQEIMSRLSERVRIGIGNNDWQAVGVGGTITTAAALLKGLHEYSCANIEGSMLCFKDIELLLKKLLPLNIEQRCGFSPLLAERGEIIVEGLQILISLMELLSLKTVKVGAGGLLEGVIRLPN